MTEFARSSAVAHLEARRSSQENSCYRAHTHDAFSVGFIESGASNFAGMTTGPVRLEPGDVILIPSGQVHACNPLDGRWRYRMIHVDEAWLTSLSPQAGTADLTASISVLRDATLRHALDDPIDAIFADRPELELRSAFAGLLGQLGAVLPELRVAGSIEPALVSTLSPALQRLRDDATNPRLDDLADLVGMDRFQLIREMKRATGLSPLAWRQNTRVLEARRRLRAGERIADTAHSLGFVDQSHFHRVFQAHVAASPGAYRRRRNFVQDPPTT